MKKIRHRLMAIIMLFVMLFSNSSWAAITANAQTGSNGSCYSATLNIWESSTKVYDTGYVDHTKLISLYANSMIIQNEDDYTITLKMRFPNSIVYFGILNPEKDGTADWRYTAGTKSWLNGYDYTSTKVPANVRAGAIKENNDNWLDYTIETDENTGYSTVTFATVYKGNIIKNLIMDCQSYTKYRPNETTGGIFVSWRRKEELPTGA